MYKIPKNIFSDGMQRVKGVQQQSEPEKVDSLILQLVFFYLSRKKVEQQGRRDSGGVQNIYNQSEYKMTKLEPKSFSDQFRFGKLSFPAPGSVNTKNYIPAKRVSGDEFRTTVSSPSDENMPPMASQQQFLSVVQKRSQYTGPGIENVLPERKTGRGTERPVPPPQREVKETLAAIPDLTRPNRSKPPRPGWEKPMMPSAVKARDHEKNQARPNAGAPNFNTKDVNLMGMLDDDEERIQQAVLSRGAGKNMILNSDVRKMATNKKNIEMFEQRPGQSTGESLTNAHHKFNPSAVPRNDELKNGVSSTNTEVNKKNNFSFKYQKQVTFAPYFQLKSGAGRGGEGNYTMAGDASGFSSGSRWD